MKLEDDHPHCGTGDCCGQCETSKKLKEISNGNDASVLYNDKPEEAQAEEEAGVATEGT